MSKVDLVGVRERHTKCEPNNERFCHHGGDNLPCDAIRLADEIERLRAKGDESKRRAEARRQEVKRTRKGFRRCEAERDRLRADHQRVTDLVNAQAEDDGLWFNAKTAPEAYLQQELRRLHAACESRAALHADDSRDRAGTEGEKR